MWIGNRVNIKNFCEIKKCFGERLDKLIKKGDNYARCTQSEKTYV